MLHHLLGLRGHDGLITSRARANSFEGFVIEQIVSLETLRARGSGYYFFRTHVGSVGNLMSKLPRAKYSCARSGSLKSRLLCAFKFRRPTIPLNRNMIPRCSSRSASVERLLN